MPLSCASRPRVAPLTSGLHWTANQHLQLHLPNRTLVPLPCGRPALRLFHGHDPGHGPHSGVTWLLSALTFYHPQSWGFLTPPRILAWTPAQPPMWLSCSCSSSQVYSKKGVFSNLQLLALRELAAPPLQSPGLVFGCPSNAASWCLCGACARGAFGLSLLPNFLLCITHAFAPLRIIKMSHSHHPPSA